MCLSLSIYVYGISVSGYDVCMFVYGVYVVLYAVCICMSVSKGMCMPQCGCGS